MFLGRGTRRTVGRRLRRAIVLAAALAVTAVAAGAQAATNTERSMHIVLGDAPPLAAYGGGIAGLAPTDPTVSGARRLNASSLPSRAYLSFLGSEQTNLISRIESALGRQVQVRFRYQAALNGLALPLSPQEADRVTDLPGVDRVVPDSTRRLLTDNGPQWIGAPGAWSGTHTGGAPGTKGEGVVVGVIDTGINTDHPSFADPGPVDDYNYPSYGLPTGPGYKGFCDPVTGLPSCNDKLIGVYDFTPVGTGEDENGHGSHTASTSAGNELNAALVAPTMTLNRHISGVAPHANVISYKACVGITAPAGECLVSALAAAINQATLDAVDVINYSIGGGPVDPWADPDSVGFLNARRAGIFVSASAGNEGPGAGTIGSPANSPWLMSVGASTHDRKLVNGLDDLTGGATTPPADIEGKSLTSGVGPAPIVDAAALGFPLCGDGPVAADGATPTINPFAPGSLAGQIVVCERGTYGRVAKGQTVKDSGAVGMVLVNDAANGDSLVGDAHVLPAVHISYANGQILKQWLAAGAGHTGTIRGTTLDVRPENGDSMASFSSRGPNVASDIVKPDVTAPGVDILAAFSDQAGPAPQYGIISGTSMSSPHAAGAAALIRALHPSWTPDEVRSALMTTAFTSPPGPGSEVHAVFKEDASTPADPFDMGGGRIDLRLAGKAGLVLDESPDDYLNANPLTGGDPKGLNIPSMANHDCRPTCTWTRVVKSVAPVSGTWNVTSTAPAGATISVSPATVTLAPGATATITVTADTTSMPVAQWRFGDVTLTPRRTSIPTPHSTLSVTRLPVAVRAQGGDVPPPCEIAEGVRTDPMEVNVLPVHDIREVGTSGLYPTFASEPMPNIIFRMKVATLDPFPTTSHWRVAFRTPGQPANLSWFVQMFRGPDPNADPIFVFGTLDSVAGTFTVLGAPEAGTWSADGTIKITLAASKIGNPQAGDVLSAITGAAGPGVPGTVTLNSDSTANGAGPTTYTLQQGCPQENRPPVANDDSATVRSGGVVNIDVWPTTTTRTTTPWTSASVRGRG